MPFGAYLTHNNTPLLITNTIIDFIKASHFTMFDTYNGYSL